MIDAEKRKTVYQLHEQGVPKKGIARLLKLDPQTVRNIISDQGQPLLLTRPERIELDGDLLEKVFLRCDRWIQRTHEVLTEEYSQKIGYSTLCRRLKELGLSEHSEKNLRCEEGELYVKPGEEMQSDTSPYIIKIGGKRTRVIACGLYLRYSKMRYVKFYLSFDRFNMKCFFFEALMHWKFSAHQCIIDNTNLAVLRGTGENAVMVPEMVEFARALGFFWKAHRIMHSNRKAGKERNFWTLETNFFPGREFSSLTDLNQQAFEWSTDRFANRPQSGSKLIPNELFEKEQIHLKPLPIYVEPPYRVYNRRTDSYGYLSIHGNFYWIPGIKREVLKVIEYDKELKIYRGHNLLVELAKLPADIKNEKVKPDGFELPKQEPHKRKPDIKEEERRLKALGQPTLHYLTWISSPKGQIRFHFKFIKELYQLSKQVTSPIFNQAMERALEYGIKDIPTLERMTHQLLSASGRAPEDNSWEREPLKYDYQSRPSYQEGCFASEPEISVYGKLFGGIELDKAGHINDEKGRRPDLPEHRVPRLEDASGKMEEHSR